MPLRTLLPLLLAVPVLAQGESARPNPRQKQPPVVQTPDQAAAGAAGETGETGDGKVLDGKELKEKMAGAAPAGPRPAHGQCHLVLSTQPKRVLPGQSGTIIAVMVLEGDAVLLSPPPVTFQITPDQGAVHLGQPQFRPAKTASVSLAPAFQGRAAYEDTAIFEVPFSVANNTALPSKHTVGIGLEFDLSQGRTGQVIGRFVDHGAVDVEVGMPLPTGPAPAARNATDPGTDASSGNRPNGGTAIPPVPTRSSAADAGAGALQGNLAPAPVAEQPPPSVGEAGPGSDAPDSHSIGSQDGTLVWLAAAGGVLVLALLAIVLARKR